MTRMTLPDCPRAQRQRPLRNGPIFRGVLRMTQPEHLMPFVAWTARRLAAQYERAAGQEVHLETLEHAGREALEKHWDSSFDRMPPHAVQFLLAFRVRSAIREHLQHPELAH